MMVKSTIIFYSVKFSKSNDFKISGITFKTPLFARGTDPIIALN